MFVVIILLSLFLCEVGLRTLSPFFSPELRTFVQQEALPFGESALRVAKGTRIILRNEDLQKPVDIIALGDSMVFGVLVKEKDLFTTIIGEQTGLTILNLGVGSTGPCIYNVMLKYALGRLDRPPSLILYSIFADDIIQDECTKAPRAEEFYIEEDEYQRNIKLKIRALREKMFHRSILYQLLKRVLTFRHLHAGVYFRPIHCNNGFLEFLFAPPSFWKPYLDSDVPTVNQGLERTLDKINSAKSLAELNGVNFMVILMPFKEQIYVPLLVSQGLLSSDIYEPYYDSTYDQLKNRLETAAITVIDLRPAFREAAGRNEKLYWTLDGHLTPLGHRLVASTLVDRLQAQLKEIAN